MPSYEIVGTKQLRDGTTHIVCETAPSQIKAQWAAAHYRAAGYEVTVNVKK